MAENNIFEFDSQMTPSKPTSRRFIWGCMWLIVLSTIFTLGLFWLSGPALLVSAGQVVRLPVGADTALPVLELRLRVSPESIELHNDLEHDSWILKRPDLAILLLEGGLIAWPESLEMRNALGVVYYAKGDYEKAAVQFQIALNSDGDLAAVRNNLGVVLVSQGKHFEAINQFQTAISLDPGNPRPLINLGNAYLRLGRGDEAIQAYKRALHYREEYPLAWSNQPVCWPIIDTFPVILSRITRPLSTTTGSTCPENCKRN